MYIRDNDLTARGQILLPLGHTLTNGHSIIILLWIIIDGRNNVTNTPPHLQSPIYGTYLVIYFIYYNIHKFIVTFFPEKKNESKNILINLRNNSWSQGCVQNGTQTTSNE